jgi:hypothetical protein
MSQTSPVSETVDDIRSAALWFEQQIENAKQDQITGFAVGPVVRGERAWARHCALYEAQQVFLKALGTSVLAQTPADTARLDWLQGRIVDTIYLDDGKIVDVRGNNLREAIDGAMKRWPGSLEDEEGTAALSDTSTLGNSQ